jgi:hypothetical protein
MFQPGDGTGVWARTVHRALVQFYRAAGGPWELIPISELVGGTLIAGAPGVARTDAYVRGVDGRMLRMGWNYAAKHSEVEDLTAVTGRTIARGPGRPFRRRVISVCAPDDTGMPYGDAARSRGAVKAITATAALLDPVGRRSRGRPGGSPGCRAAHRIAVRRTARFDPVAQPCEVESPAPPIPPQPVPLRAKPVSAHSRRAGIPPRPPTAVLAGTRPRDRRLHILGLVALAVAAAVACAWPSVAVGVKWTGKGDGESWSDAKNWEGEKVPEEDDMAEVQQLPNGSPARVKVGGDQKIKGLTLGTGGALLGGKITVTSAPASGAPSTFAWTGGELSSNLTLGPLTVSVVSGSAQKRLHARGGKKLVNKGAMLVTAGVTVQVFDGRIANRGTLALQFGSALQGMVCCVNPSGVDNTGTVRVIPGLTLKKKPAVIASMSLDSSGKVAVSPGILDLISAPNDFSATHKFTGRGRVRVSNGAGTVPATATLHQRLDLGARTKFELADGGVLVDLAGSTDRNS